MKQPFKRIPIKKALKRAKNGINARFKQYYISNRLKLGVFRANY